MIRLFAAGWLYDRRHVAARRVQSLAPQIQEPEDAGSTGQRASDPPQIVMFQARWLELTASARFVSSCPRTRTRAVLGEAASGRLASRHRLDWSGRSAEFSRLELPSAARPQP
jgi:hypothetical protein